MDERKSHNLNGSLLEWPVRAIERAHLEACGGMEFRGELESSCWEEFSFTSDEPLRGEDQAVRAGPYTYTVICRRSGPRIAFLSLNRRIVDRLADRLAAEVLAFRLRRVSIAVDSLGKAIVERPTRFSISFVYARVPAFGAALRNVSFYGDDLGEASLFRDNIHLLNIFVCGLRPAAGGSEIVRLGSDGRISFNMQSPGKVLEVENVLRFLRQEGYLSTEIWPEG
jgi:hypothetical protein